MKEDYVINSNYLTSDSHVEVKILNNDKKYVKNTTPKASFSNEDNRWHFSLQANDRNLLTNDIDSIEEKCLAIEVSIKLLNSEREIEYEATLIKKPIKIVALWQVV